MTTVPTTEPERRTIGDILLDHGFVTEEALAAATAEQVRTAQPLGQILVQAGAITRLELASALAEQWSDPSVSITPLPRAQRGLSSAPARDRAPDDAQYAERLQDAVADLARRVQANGPVDDFEQRLADLSERIEATLARTQVIEATVATLAESLEGVTEGVEEAFKEIQTGTAELAQELVRIDGTLAELAARPTSDPAVAAELSARIEELSARLEAAGDARATTDELRASVTELLARPQPDETLGGRIDELTARLEAVADSGALDDVRSSITELEARPVANPELAARLQEVEAALESHASRDALTELTARLDDFHATVGDLLSRSPADAEARERLEQIETTLGSHAPAEAVSELAERIAGLEHLDAAVTELQARVTSDPAADDRIELIEAAIAALPQREALAELALRIDTLDELLLTSGDLDSRPAGDHVIDARLQRIEAALAAQPAPTAPAGPEITSAIDAIAELDARLGALDQRIASLPDVEAQDLLARQTLEALSERLGTLDQRVAALPEVEVQELASRQALEGLSERLDAAEAEREATSQALRETQDRLAVHLETLEGAPENPALDELRQAIAALGQTREPNGVDGRIEELTQAIEGIRTDMTGISVWAATDPEVIDQIDTLAARVDALHASAGPDPELIDKLAELEARFGSQESATEERQVGTDAVTALRGRVEELAAELASIQPVDPAPALEDLRLELEASIAKAVVTETGSAAEEATNWAAEHAALEARIDGLAQRFEEAPRAPDTVLRHTIDPSDESGGFEVEMERVLMAIERLSLHLAGHDRALAEMMKSRGSMDRLDELSDRMDDMAAGAGGGGGGEGASPAGNGDSEPRGDVRALARRVEETVAAAAADRAKLMDQLDKMASSIDWRLLRLEGAGEPDPDS